MKTLKYFGMLLVGAMVASPAMAVTSVSVTLTPLSLGLGSSTLNGGTLANSDIAGKFVTNATPTGTGSILWVQQSGVAGQGTAGDPLLATITAKTRLDQTFANPRDRQAGVIYLSSSGLGVRAYDVSTSGYRQLWAGRAWLTGGNQVDGGMGVMDESVTFTFAPDSYLVGESIWVLFRDFESYNRFDLSIDLLDGGTLSFNDLGPASSWSGAANWQFDFSDLPGLDPLDAVTAFTIQAVQTASHKDKTTDFFIKKFGGNIYEEPTTEPTQPPVPEPLTAATALMALLGLGIGATGRARKA